ncbi:MAG TPA: hypothetical protein ENI12_00415 [Nitrospirae bacterium]|nr:hypothetical protein [Nitrospirota bacterium]
MNDSIQRLVRQIKQMEEELLIEIQKKEAEFFYEIRAKKIRFEKKIKAQHKAIVKKLPRYLYDAAFLNMLTVPVIWSCLIPVAFLDLIVMVFQFICFPVYGIPKVKRKDYIIIDRHYLSYLNTIEKINCLFCGYFIGVISIVQEVAARTEQYWCPIKHARRLRTMHSRYKNFIDYGDGIKYKEKLQEVRRDFNDLR